MRTARLLPVSPSMHCAGECLLPRGCLLWGLSAPGGGCTPAWTEADTPPWTERPTKHNLRKLRLSAVIRNSYQWHHFDSLYTLALRNSNFVFEVFFWQLFPIYLHYMLYKNANTGNFVYFGKKLFIILTTIDQEFHHWIWLQHSLKSCFVITCLPRHKLFKILWVCMTRMDYEKPFNRLWTECMWSPIHVKSTHRKFWQKHLSTCINELRLLSQMAFSGHLK